MAITQVISTIPQAGHRGVDARDTFVTKQEEFQDALTDTFVTEINAFRTQANTLETNVNTKEASASIARDEAVAARNEAVGAVATLPDGIINDGTISATDTWSSSKINTTFSSKSDTTHTHTSFSGLTVTSLKETKVAMAASNIDLSLGNLFTKTISGATTLTVSNVPTTGTVAYLILELTNAGSATITWFSGVKWAGGTAPTLTSSGKDIISMYTHDAGTTWNVNSIQKDVK